MGVSQSRLKFYVYDLPEYTRGPTTQKAGYALSELSAISGRIRRRPKTVRMKWTPKLRPAAKLDFSRSARHEKEQIDETKTQAVQWCLQGASWLGGLNGSENDGANRAREPGVPASGGSMEKDRSGAVARSL